jgi:hypothetical protein
MFRYVPSSSGLFHLAQGEVPPGVLLFGGNQDEAVSRSSVPLLRHPASAERPGFRERAFQICFRNPVGYDGVWRLVGGPDWSIEATVVGPQMDVALVRQSTEIAVLRVPLMVIEQFLWIRVSFGPDRGTTLSYHLSDVYEIPAPSGSVETEASCDLLAYPWEGGLVEVGLSTPTEMLDSPEWESSGMRTGGIPVSLIGVSAIVLEPS